MAQDKTTIMREAQKFVAKGQYDRAIAEWKKLLKESPGDANLYNTIGDLCLKKDAKTDAVEAYRKAAEILASDGFMSKAIALYKKTLNIDPRNINVHLSLADLNAEKGLTTNALESYKIVVDHYAQQKDMGKALGIYQKMADLNSSNVSFRIKLAEMYAKQGMVAEASAAYLHAADVHLSNDAFNEARQLFEKVLTLDPANKTVYYKAGIVYIKEGKFSEACKALKPAFENDPNNRELANTYVEALTRAGKENDVEQVLRKIVDADPGRTDSIQKLYAIYLARNDYDKALESASSLVEAFVAKDDHDAAEGFLKKLIASSPQYAPGLLKLAQFYITIRRDDDAARTFYQAAEVLSDERDRDRAIDALSRALDIDPELPGARDLFEQLSRPVIAIPPASEPEGPQVSDAAVKPVEWEHVVQEAAMPVWESPAETSAVETPIAEASSIEPPVSAPLEVVDPAITEACTEVDVLIKYGLTTKALEQLENLARKFPDSIQVRIKLSDLYGDVGQMNKAAAHMRALADLYTAQGKHDQAQETLRTAMNIHPADVEAVTERHGAPPAAVPAATAGSSAPVEPPAVETALAAEPPSTIEPPDSHPPEVSEGFQIEPVVPDEAAAFHEPAPTDASVFMGLDASMPQITEEASYEEPLLDRDMPSSEPAAGPLLEEGLPVIELPADEFAPDAFTEELKLPPEEPVTNIELQAVAEETAPPEEIPESADRAAPEYEPQAVAEETAPPEEIPENAENRPQTLVESAAPFVEELVPVKETESPPLETEFEEPVDEQVVETFIQKPGSDVDMNEIWAEAEFYFQQGLFNEAKKHYAKIIELYPNDKQAIARIAEISREEEETKEFTRLADAVESLEEVLSAEPTGEELPLSASDEEAVRSLMSEIAGLKKPMQQSVSTPPIARNKETMSPPPPRIEGDLASENAASPQGDAEGEFFDLGEELQKESMSAEAQQAEQKADDFFDLASELRDELSGIAVPTHPPAAEEQSLDEIFEEFKRGIEQTQTAKEDVDTHYNLGVAYKEMGLLDDAIAEFSLTPEDEPKLVHSRYMLGLCYMEKGEFERAITEIEYALTHAEGMGESESARVEMRYDLGLAYQGAGNMSSALREFQKVHSSNPRYRDTAAKLKELKKGDFISPDQLKDDIEKEISSKFLEEGERIEREEKNRKNEKVRN